MIVNVSIDRLSSSGDGWRIPIAAAVGWILGEGRGACPGGLDPGYPEVQRKER